MIKNSGHSHKIALLVTVIVTAVLTGLVVVFGSIIYQNYIEVKTGRSSIATDQAKESALVVLQELTKETTENKDSLTGFVITKDNLARFIDLIEEVGAKRGATTSVVSANELGGVDKKAEVLVGWQLELRLAGQFDQVWQGLKLIEALPVAKEITEVNLIRTSVPGSVGAANWAGGVVINLPTTK